MARPQLQLWSRRVGAGLAAILTWVAIVVFVKWYQTRSGYLAYWSVALGAALILEILTVMAPSLAKKLIDPVANLLSSVFENYEANMAWIVWLFLICFYGVILYFILMAPYGLLCHLGFRPCGQ